MEIIELRKNTEHHSKDVWETDPFAMLQDELTSALSMYWSTAAHILKGSGVNLLEPPHDLFSLSKNFFSALFLYSYHRARIPRRRRILYGAINQCLRGMVTGCDNVLDDEYKKTLETDLPAQGTRFRSIIDIMVSDRVLFEILLMSREKNHLTYEQVISSSAASLRALAKSGAQESSEEGGISMILKPEEILRSVHHYKTGILFQCPWAVPSVIEESEREDVSLLLEALYRIGIGCQIMDDMVDLSRDAQERRHNYVISLIYHDADCQEQTWLEALPVSNLSSEKKSALLLEFPRARAAATKAALGYLEKGLGALFAAPHQFLVEPSIMFISKRIGVDHLLWKAESCGS